MDRTPGDFWYDYVDPASYLVELLLRELEAADPGDGVPRSRALTRRRPLEVVPPPRPLLDPSLPPWSLHLEAMREEARRMGVSLAPPPLIPWTRKAHELALHAAEKGCFPAIHRAIFDGFFRDSRDIGRVDVLVEIAVGCGLDRSETRAVLDVDRFAAAVGEERAAAAAAGVRGVPTLIRSRGLLEGFCDRARLREFLREG
jgi:2-hydroxychromene-2-carboxylate isomerase